MAKSTLKASIGLRVDEVFGKTFAALAYSDPQRVGTHEEVFWFSDTEAHHAAGLGDVPFRGEFGLSGFRLPMLPVTVCTLPSPLHLPLTLPRMILLSGARAVFQGDRLSTPHTKPLILVHRSNRYHQSMT